MEKDVDSYDPRLRAIKEWYDCQPPEVQAVVDREADAARLRIAEMKLTIAMAQAEPEPYLITKTDVAAQAPQPWPPNSMTQAQHEQYNRAMQAKYEAHNRAIAEANQQGDAYMNAYKTMFGGNR